MVRKNGFELQLMARGRPLVETRIGGEPYVMASDGSSFEVRVLNSNDATYMVRLFVDGVEAEPGYVKKLRADDETVFRGYVRQACPRTSWHQSWCMTRPPIARSAARTCTSSSSRRRRWTEAGHLRVGCVESGRRHA